MLCKLGANSLHRLALLHEESTASETMDAYDALKPLFKETNILEIPPGKAGFINRTNDAFRFLVTRLQSLYQTEPREAFYWFELDNAPLTPRWMDILQSEYLSSGKAHMGVQEPVWVENQDGGWDKKDGHMPRSSIYNIGVGLTSTLINFLVQSFDIEMQHELWSQTHPARGIQLNYGTGNYTRCPESGVITCESLEGQDVDYPINYANPIRDEAVVVQGCLDDSLLTLLLNE